MTEISYIVEINFYATSEFRHYNIIMYTTKTEYKIC